MPLIVSAVAGLGEGSDSTDALLSSLRSPCSPLGDITELRGVGEFL